MRHLSLDMPMWVLTCSSPRQHARLPEQPGPVTEATRLDLSLTVWLQLTGLLPFRSLVTGRSPLVWLDAGVAQGSPQTNARRCCMYSVAGGENCRGCLEAPSSAPFLGVHISFWDHSQVGRSPRGLRRWLSKRVYIFTSSWEAMSLPLAYLLALSSFSRAFVGRL